MTVLEQAQVTSLEPAVGGKGFFVQIWAVLIADKDIGAASQDLSTIFVNLFISLFRRFNLHLHSRYRKANAFQITVLRHTQGKQGRSFCKTITDGYFPT